MGSYSQPYFYIIRNNKTVRYPPLFVSTLFAYHRSRMSRFHPPRNRWLRSLLLGEIFSIGLRRTSPIRCRYSFPKARGYTSDSYSPSRSYMAFTGGRCQKQISTDCRSRCFLFTEGSNCLSPSPYQSKGCL